MVKIIFHIYFDKERIEALSMIITAVASESKYNVETNNTSRGTKSIVIRILNEIKSHYGPLNTTVYGCGSQH